MDLVQPSGLVDGPLAIDLVPGEHHHGADRVGDRHERLVLRLGELSVIGFSAGHLVNVCITESLDKKNSPSAERWCRYTPRSGVRQVEVAPLGSGLLHRSRW